MKTAKEWAESVVTAVPHEDVRAGKTFLIQFENGDDYHWFDQVDASAGVEREEVEYYRAIVERLVERVQADARAPLVKLISELADELRERVYYADDGADVEPLLAKAEEALR